MEDARPRGNFYSGMRLDRGDRLRRDRDWLAARLANSASRFVPVWRARNLIRSETELSAVWLDGPAGRTLQAQASETVFLGLDGETAYFAIDLSALEEPEATPEAAGGGAPQGKFLDLRAVGPLVARAEGAILAYARGVIHWHQRHRFCGVCGGATASALGGHQRLCLSQDCGTQHFPRTDPAVIMLIHDGERCVLGRQKIWPDGMHSTLAGFVEPGESLEEAVAREIMEEVGIQLDQISYQSSQPWPFPASLMLGFHATCRHRPLRIDQNELAAADWYSRDALKTSPEDDSFRLPRRDSIARRLIDDWLAED